MDTKKQIISSVPFIDLRFEEGFEEKVIERWKQSLSNKAFVSGIGAKELESKILDFTKAQNFVPCANGTDAIQIALRSVGVGLGDVVLLPDFTFWATYEAIENVGAKPVMVDITEKDLQMDFDLFVRAVEKYKPKAAILVHLYGWCSEWLSDFRNYCKKQEIYLIEDAAQAIGTKYQNESIFKSAYIATTSFYPAKVLGAAGDAGGVFTTDKDIAQKCLQLSNHGRSAHYGHEYVGWNSRMDELQSHFLCESIELLQKRLDSRRASEQKYIELILKSDKELPLDLKMAPLNVTSNGYLQVSIAKGSYKDLSSKLNVYGIKTGNIYPSPMSAQEGAKEVELVTEEKIAYSIANKVINLPLFPYMLDEEVEYVFECLKKV